MKLRLITRNSRLALWQANLVQQELLKHHPSIHVEIIPTTTRGDQILDKSLELIGGKGLFIKELEQQLLLGNADIAVHSLKDLPAQLSSDFMLGAVLKRANPADGLISSGGDLADLAPASTIGTSSARRRAIIQHYYPHLTVKLLRGNVDTRINKLDRGEYTAIILACAGLERLGLGQRLRQTLDTRQFIPAIAQGAIAIECVQNNPQIAELLQPLNDYVTWCCVSAERIMGYHLNASCNIPIAGFATVNNTNDLTLSGLVADNGKLLQASASGKITDYLHIGADCARQLLSQGADKIIARYAF